MQSFCFRKCGINTLAAATRMITVRMQIGFGWTVLTSPPTATSFSHLYKQACCQIFLAMQSVTDTDTDETQKVSTNSEDGNMGHKYFHIETCGNS